MSANGTSALSIQYNYNFFRGDRYRSNSRELSRGSPALLEEADSLTWMELRTISDIILTRS